jgi:hypothetical protein
MKAQSCAMLAADRLHRPEIATSYEEIEKAPWADIEGST